MAELKIKRDFAAFLPRATDEEDVLLEKLLTEHGCEQPLVVWQEAGVLLDGHRRRRICDKLDIEYKIKAKSFDSEDKALVWMAENQLGRRNLTDQQRAYFLGKRYLDAVGDQGGAQKDRPNVAETLADEVGVTPQTVLKASQFTQVVDRLAEMNPKARTAILSGDAEASSKDVLSLSNLPESILAVAAQKIADGKLMSEIKENLPQTQPTHRRAKSLDDKDIARSIGALVRAITARAKIHGETREYRACEKALELLDASWRAWHVITS